MGLVRVVQGLKAVVAGVDSAVPVRDPGDQIAPYPAVVVYPVIGDSTPSAHAGHRGRTVSANRDTVVIEWHWQPPDVQRFAEAGPGLVDAVRDAIWIGARDRTISPALDRISTIRLDAYGRLDWGSDATFGFRLLVDLTHFVEAGGPPDA